jgi:hypothetical protein
MSELLNIEGVLVPKSEQGAPVTFLDRIRPNLNPKQQKYVRRRDRMIQENMEAWENDKSRTRE